MILRIATLFCFLTILLPLADASAQTRFARPDTTPDYASYRHFDECVAAINRLERLDSLSNPLWRDTVDVDTMQYLDSAPESIADASRQCIAKVNIDSIPLKYVASYARALLLANRDDDVERMFLRLKDSIIADDSLGIGFRFIISYLDTKPSRIEKAERLYNLLISSMHPDSASKKNDLSSGYAFIALRSGNRALASRTAEEIMRILDTLSDKYKQPNAFTDQIRFKFLSSFLPQEAIDSLTISTDAYRNYLAHLWTSITGHAPHDEIGPFARQAPQLTGQYWYSNRNGKIEKIAPTTSIETPAITILYFAQGGCHSNYASVSPGRNNGSPSACWGEIHGIRKLMEQYPNIKLVVVSQTFGSFADAPPLTPEEEADTLAHYFLGFHKLRGIHIISQTDFFRLPTYDNRIIDSRTENELAYVLDNKPLATFNNVVMIDELGKIFHFGSVSGIYEFTAEARLKAVMHRAANRTKE